MVNSFMLPKMTRTWLQVLSLFGDHLTYYLVKSFLFVDFFLLYFFHMSVFPLVFLTGNMSWEFNPELCFALSFLLPRLPRSHLSMKRVLFSRHLPLPQKAWLVSLFYTAAHTFWILHTGQEHQRILKRGQYRERSVQKRALSPLQLLHVILGGQSVSTKSFIRTRANAGC